MSVLTLPERTTEDLYHGQVQQAHLEDSARYRLLRQGPEQPAEQPVEQPDAPGVVQGFMNVLADLSTRSVGDAALGFLGSVAGDTFTGLRQLLSPGEAVSNVVLSGGDAEEFGRTMGEVFRNAEPSTTPMDFAARFSDNPIDQLAIGTTAQILTDPLTYVPVVGAVQAGRKLKAAQAMAGATVGGRGGLSGVAAAVAPGSDELLRLARQAEGGSKRAAQKLTEVLSSESAAPLIAQMEQSTINRDYARLFSVGGKGMPMPKAERRQQAVLTYQRREGNADLLVDELTNGPRPAPYKHAETYLRMNGPEDAQSFANVYVAETRRYVETAIEKATGMRKLRLQEELLRQPSLLKRQIGDNIPADLDPVTAFAHRRLLSDLASTARRQVNTTEMKFRSNIDYLRFWKLVSARESIRANLTGTIENEAPGIMSMLSTYGEDRGIQILKADRAILRLPTIDAKLERKIARSLSSLDINQSEMYFNGLFPIAGLDKRMHRLWLNSLLSNPITHSRNMVSNLGVALMKPVSELGAAPVALARGSTGDAMIHLRRARELTLGYADVMLDSMRIMSRNPTPTAQNRQMFKNMHEASIIRPRLSRQALETASPMTRALDTLASYMPVEMLGKTDTWFKSLTYRADIRAAAAETASRMTTDPRTRRELTRQLVNDPLELMKMDAFKAAEMMTFQSPLPEKLAEAINAARKFPAMKWVVPFVTTPLNIVTMGIRHSPFAPVLSSVRNDLAAGGVARDMALSRVAVVQGLGLAGVTMLDDRVTGADNQRLRLNQMPEYSIRIGDKWYSYKYIEPMRWTLGPMADLREMVMSTDWDAREGAETFQAAMGGFVGGYYHAVLDNFFMFQVSNVIDATRRGLEDGTWGRLLSVTGQIGQGFVPAGAAWANRMFIDQNVRELDTFTSRLMNRIPGLSTALPPKVGLLGEPQTHARQLLGLLPADINQASLHPLYAQLQVTQATVPDVAKALRGVELSASQRAALRIWRANPAGTISLADASVQLIESPTYRAAGPEGRAEYLHNLLLKYNELANRQLWEEDALLRETAVETAKLTERLRGQR